MPTTKHLSCVVILLLTLQSIQAQQQSSPQTPTDLQVPTTANQPQSNHPEPQSINEFKVTFESALNQQYNMIKQLKVQTQKQIQKLQEFDKQVKSWNQILEKINNVIHSVNKFLSSFNDKATAIMARVVGFEQELKAIISIDTLIVCILSLILVKILKDEFIEEGYQPVGGLSQHHALSANSAVNTTLSEREMD